MSIESRNIPIRTVGDMLTFIEFEFKYGTPGKYVPMTFIGKGGIGKSSIVKQLTHKLAEELNCDVGYKDIRLVNFDAVDLKGVPVPDIETKTTQWLVNNVYPDEKRDGKRGILVLDEITSANEQTQTGVYQLLAERKLNNYDFPEGWMIVCLGNGEEDGGTYNQLTPNFVNRGLICYVESDKKEWLKWARNAGIHELILAYVAWEGSTLHGFDPSIIGLDGTCFPSPRTYTLASGYLNYPITSKDPKDPIPAVVADLIKCTIGEAEGSKFLAFADLRKSLVNIDDILKGEASTIDMQDDKADQYISLAIEGLITRMRDIGKNFNNAKGNKSKQEKIATDSIDTFANIITWLMNLDYRDYVIRFISACLSDEVINSLFIYLLWEADFDKRCPEIRELLSEIDDKPKEVV